MKSVEEGAGGAPADLETRAPIQCLRTGGVAGVRAFGAYAPVTRSKRALAHAGCS